jgi:HEAT repeat protein
MLINDRPAEALAANASAPPSVISSLGTNADQTGPWEDFVDRTALRDRMLRRLREGTDAERADAAEAIGALRLVACTSDLARVAADSAVPEPVRLAAIRGLSKMADGRPVLPLLAIARDPAEPELAREARATLRLLASGHGWQDIDKVPEAMAALTELGQD